MSYEPQRLSRQRKLEEGWKRVEAFLDPETAREWDRRLKAYGGPTALVKAALAALSDSPKAQAQAPRRKR